MVQQVKPAKMFYKFDGDPDGNELSGYRNKLQEKPNFVQRIFSTMHQVL
jgi:hypothetical protein